MKFKKGDIVRFSPYESPADWYTLPIFDVDYVVASVCNTELYCHIVDKNLLTNKNQTANTFSLAHAYKYKGPYLSNQGDEINV